VKEKAFLLSCMLTLTLALAPNGEAQGAGNAERAGAQEREPTRQDTAKNLINNMRAAFQKMKEQEETLKELSADPSSPRAGYTKFQKEGAPVRAQAEAEETKEGGASSVVHKMPGRTRAGEVGVVGSGAATRADCRNNLKQLAQNIERDADKLHRLSRGTKKKTFLMEVERLRVEARRVREAAMLIPEKPDPAAEQKAMEGLAAAMRGLEAQLETVSLTYKEIK